MKGVAEIGDRLLPEIVDGRHAGVPVARAREPSFEIQIVVMAGAQRSCGPPSTAPRRREWDSRRVTLSAPFGLLSSAFIDSHEGTRIPLSQLASIEPAFGPGAIRGEPGARLAVVDNGNRAGPLCGAPVAVLGPRLFHGGRGDSRHDPRGLCRRDRRSVDCRRHVETRTSRAVPEKIEPVFKARWC